MMLTADESLQRARKLVQQVAFEDTTPISSNAMTVAVEIGAEIIEELIPQGDDLNSVQLAQRYGSSRTPIREALMVLEKQGLVVIKPRLRPRVGVIDSAQAREIFRARAALMASIARDIVTSASPSDLDSLEEEIDGMASALQRRDSRAFFWANTNFHIKNIAIAHNGTVQRIVNSLILRSMWLRRLTLRSPERWVQTLSEHQQIVQAYKARDIPLVEVLSRLNHLNALRAMELELARAPAPAARQK